MTPPNPSTNGLEESNSFHCFECDTNLPIEGQSETMIDGNFICKNCESERILGSENANAKGKSL